MKNNLFKNLLKTAFLLAVVLVRFEGFGQISVTSSALTYTQNFNSYAGSSASLPSGWSASGTFTYRGTGNGSSATGGAWAYGTAGGQEDLGALASTTSNDIIYAVSFVNNTGTTITSLVISFNFDQWANNGGNTNGFTVSGTGGLNTSPINSSLNTNLSTSSCISSCGSFPTSTVKTYTLTGLSISNGSTYGLSWEDVDGSGSDNPIGIDNFAITAVACTTPTVSVAGTQTICAGQTTTLTASGASTYSWSTGATTATISINPTTTTIYTVTGNTSGGCSAAQTATVTVVQTPTVSVAGTHTICVGQTTTLTASGASSYTWSTGANTAAVTLNPTTTSVYTVTGSNGTVCSASVKTTTVTVNVSPTIIIAGTQTICAGQTTTLTASGASTYTWNTGANTAAVAVSPTTTTAYTVTATNSSGCGSVKTATVTVNTSPTISVSGTQNICSGQTTTLTASGASTYTWSTSATTSTVALNPTSTTGYTVTGTNSSGCQGTNNPTITVVQTPTVSISGTQTICAGQTTTLTASGASTYTWNTSAHTAAVALSPTTTTVYTVTGSNGSVCSVNTKTATVIVTYSASLSATHTNSACYGGSTGAINLTASGGTSPFTYSWTGPGGYTSSSQNISGLAAGSYSVIVISAGGCTSTTVTTITQPSVALSVQANASVNSSACTSSAKGSVILVVSGGSTPYSYSWSNGSTSQNQSNLSAGIYSVTVTDANGCAVTTSVDFSALGTKIASFPYVQSFESGAGGWVTGALNQTIGGVSNQYVNDWATGTPSKANITTSGDGSKCWVTGGLTGSFYDFYEKSYVQSPVLDLTNVQYPVLSFMLYRESEYQYDGANVSYSTNGGSTWTVLGAQGDSTDCDTKNWYNYSGITYLGASGGEDGWSGNVEASYTDPNDNTNTCQGGHGSGGWIRVKHCLTGLGGNNCVLLRFNYGAGYKCNNYDGFAFDSVAVGSGIATSPHYTYGCSGVNTLTFTASNNSCIKATSWNWNFGDSLSGSNTSTSTNPSHVFSHPGTYTVSLSTSGACNPAGTYTSAVTVFGPAVSGTQTICSGQSTTLTASGASTYTWSTGAHTTTITVSPTTTTSYTVTGTSSGGCAGSIVTTVTVNPSFTIAVTHTNIACSGASTGAINLTASGGTSPFTYSWTGPSSYTSSSQNISGLAAGNYSVVVTSATGCSSSTVTTITQPSVALTVNASTNESNACSISATGSITLTVNGGNTPYTYSWSNGSTSQNQSSLSAGVYSVTVTDANGCAVTASSDLSDLGTKIASFPYTQSFESGPGGWFAGALNQTIGGVSNQYVNDWACGAPSKSHITTAGDGSKCWVTGGLTGSFYDFYEKSYVQSPVFDFTGLQYPVLSFKLYRESEYKYDGANVSYSTNGGSTWTVLGAQGDSTDCDTKNWYNYSGITYLGASGGEDGWSGNVEASYTDPNDNTNTCQGGHGSGGWIKVQHCLTGLGNTSCVMLRINYGAGYKCNNYDGFAFDSVAIGTGIATSPHYTYGCSGVNTLTFTASNNSCIKATSWNWNFGDSLSGSNTSTSTNPSHVFSHPGTYTVSLSTSGACNPAGTYTSAVTVFGPAVSGTQTICSGQSTTLTASGASTYTWSTGAHTTTITVSPTTTTIYTLTATSSGGCSGSITPTITVITTPTVGISGTQTICTGQTTTLTASGATSYSWNTGATTASVAVSPTTTTVYTVTGATSGCSAAVKTVTVTVNATPTVSVSGTNTICSGQTTTLTASGASTYTWSTGAHTATVTLNPIATTVYTVTGTTGSCTSSNVTATVTVNATPTVSISGTQTICPGQTTTLTASGATTYSWNTGATTASMSVAPTSTTIYTVTGTTTGCSSANKTVTVVVNSNPTITISGTNTICAGQTTTLTASGASTYTWSIGANTAGISVSPTTTTVYSVSGTSASGCIGSSKNDTVKVNSDPTITISGTNVICVGQTTTLTASGASTYTWSTGAHAAGISVNPRTTTVYTVSGTSASGCSGNSVSDTVTVKSNPVISASGVDTICSGQSTTLTASGASTYTWSTGATTAGITINPTTTTVYSVTGTSASGCIGSSITNTVTVNSGPVISISGPHATCSGQNVTLTASGANTYTWSTGSHNDSVQVSPSTTTIYSVTGTTLSGCTGAAVIDSITVYANPTISISGSDTICLGQTTVLTASGASTYTWNTGSHSNSISVSPGSTTIYTVTGTSVTGCIGSVATATVLVHAVPAISISGVNSICVGQTTTLMASGANTYTWSTGSHNDSISVNPTSTTIYTVSGTNINGCVGSSVSDTVTVHNNPTLSISGTHIICAGQTITLTASGAGTYTWSTGQNGTTIQVNPTATTVYSVSGTSQFGCVGTGISDTIIVNSDPSSISISGTQTICAGQNTTLTASGATTYTWSTGVHGDSVQVNPTTTTVYTVTGTNTSGCIATATSTVTVNPISGITVSGINALCTITTTTLTASGANTYTWSTGATAASVVVSPGATTVYTVTGANSFGCISSTTSTVSVNQNLPISISGGGAQTICSGHAITLTASGANVYTWSTGAVTNSISVNPTATAVYTVSGTNAGGCSGTATTTVTVNATPTVSISGDQTICTGQTLTLAAAGATTYVWSTGATSASISVSPITTTVYTVTGTSNGCSQSVANTVPVNITPTITVTGNMALCSSSTTTLTASGANTYSWSTGAATASIAVSPTATAVYTVTGTSISGCKNSATSAVTVNQSLPIIISGSQTICSGQTTTLTAMGATSYSWSTTATTGSIAVSPTATTVYTVSGTNPGGCSGTGTATVTVNSNLSLSISGTQTVCSNQATTLTATGATSYTWNTGVTTASISVNPSATTIYAVNGVSGACRGTATATVSVNAAPALSVSGVLAICSTPTTALTASGASTYTWSTGATTASVVVSPTTTTVYTLSGTNPNGCQSSITTTVTVDQNLSLVVGGIKTICAGNSTTLTASGANSYTWSTGAHSASITVSPTSTAIYSLTASSSAGCVGSLMDTVTVIPLPTISISGNQNLCPGQATVLTASGANTYAWSTGANSSSVTVSPSGTTVYTVTGINATGCKTSSTVTVTLNAGPTVSLGGNQTICFGQSTTLTASGASTYTWSTGSTASSITVSPSATKTYTVTGTSSAGCTGPGTVFAVTVNQTPTVSISGGQSICQGQSTTLTAAGADSYTWSSGETTSSVTKNPTTTTSYTVTGKNSIGCSDSVSVTVIVIQTPTVSIAGSQTICAGNNATLTASGANTYNWSTGASSATIEVSPTTTTTYSVVGSNGGTCTTNTNVTVVVNQGPTIGIGGIQSICSGQTTTLTASGADSYTWNPGGVISATIAVSPSVTTVYQVAGSVSSGVCTIGYQNAAVVVTASPVIALDSSATVCSGGVYQVTASVSNGTYTWTPVLSGLTPIISTTSQTSYTLSASNGSCYANKSITVTTITCTPPPCTNCLGSFSPEPGKKYLFTAWVKEESALPTTTTYTNSKAYIEFPAISVSTGDFYASGTIIDGWQRIEKIFFIPANAIDIKVHLESISGNSYYDDVRVFPFDGSVKSYVYDPVSRRLVAELDERNYATLYEYDEEGKLLRIKKETERGVMTIQESKSKSRKE